MSDKRYLGNIITNSSVEPEGPFEDSTASGVWSVAEAMAYTKADSWPTAGRVAFGNAVTFSTATGATPTTYTVPAGVTSLRVKCWGAGGGAAENNSSSVLSYGGGGGFCQSDIEVTPGETLNIYVATAGQNSTDAGYYSEGASGGGYSAVFRGSTPLVVAAGGGGGAYLSGAPGYKSNGGQGGGSIGGSGQSTSVSGAYFNGGLGGTQSAGGASVGVEKNGLKPESVSEAGTYLQGGTGGSLGSNGRRSGGLPGGGDSGGYTTGERNAGGGGGGGGYYGGSGGCTGYYGYDQGRASGGGGGSSYAVGTNVINLSGTSYPAVIKSNDEDYVGTAGRGGVEGPTAASPTIGLVVLRYSS